MADDYAEAVMNLVDEVDRACEGVSDVLTNAEIAEELRRMAQAWEDSA